MSTPLAPSGRYFAMSQPRRTPLSASTVVRSPICSAILSMTQVAYSEAQLNLHGSTAISRDLEGVYGLVQSKDAGQQRGQIHSPLVDEVDGQAKLLMETKGPAHF